MLARIGISNLRVEAILGVHDRERKMPQPILLDLGLWVDVEEAARLDDVKRTVDYSAVAREIDELVRERKRFTIEALELDLLRMLFVQYSEIGKIEVSIRKPMAITSADSAEVSIEMRRDEFEERFFTP